MKNSLLIRLWFFFFFWFGVISTILRVTATSADGLCEVKILIKN